MTLKAFCWILFVQRDIYVLYILIFEMLICILFEGWLGLRSPVVLFYKICQLFKFSLNYFVIVGNF